MKTVTLEAVRDAVTMLNIRSGKGLSSDNVSLLALEYTEDFEDEDVTAAEFDFAYRRVRKEANGYIPNSGRFLDVIRAERARPRDVSQLTAQGEAPMSQEEINRNVRRLKILANQIAGKITADEADRLIAEVL